MTQKLDELVEGLREEIRQLQARHKKYEKALRSGAVMMRKARKIIEGHEMEIAHLKEKP